MFRHMVEAHQGSKDADDTVLWQIADLAKRRLRQVHGLGYADDPGRATELLGPLAGGPGLPRPAAAATSPAAGTGATASTSSASWSSRMERL